MSIALQILGASIGQSFLLDRYAPRYSIGVVSNAILIYLVQFSLYNVWSILIYPHFFSPIRHVPEAPGSSFFTGQTRTIMKASSGQPMREWIETTPNDG